MVYPYGPRSAPAVGLGLPGLPRRKEGLDLDPGSFPFVVAVLRQDGNLIVPDWATLARVTSIGRGGRGVIRDALTLGGGGGGGGLAGSLVETVAAGDVITAAFTATATFALFNGSLLSGGNGGDAVLSSAGAGGIGSGGAVNFNGGAGAAGRGTASTGTDAGGGGGGGAAGRGGNGLPAIPGNGTSTNSTGGDGGPGVDYFGGGASGGSGSPNSSAGTTQSNVGASQIALGQRLVVGLQGRTYAATTLKGAGGEGGGGGGGGRTGDPGTGEGGAGLVIIELW